MKYQMRAIKNLIILLSLAVFFPAMCFASADLSVALGDVRFKPNNILAGQTVRIYVTIHNTGDTDTLGRVQIFDETAGIQISTDQPVSLIAGGADTIFADWIPLLGERRLRIKVTALSPDSNPKNDVVIQNVFADNDFDRDGIGDALDPDDDNDGVPDARDQFPKNAKEWQDTDSDGTGDNADTDDDNDGITDMDELKIGTSPYLKDTDGDKFIDSEDVFPLDAKEWLDTDKDGIGNNADPDDDNDNYCDQPPEISKVCKLNADNSGDRFPLDFKEWHDIDNDAIGDNVDKDNDNDSLNDVDEKVIGADPRNPDTDGDTYLDGLDAFPLDAKEWKDTDKDGIGDNADIAPNDPAPKAILSFESDVVEAAIGEEIIFDASKSNDQNGQIMQYIWDFGDGIKSEDQIARHAYLESGEYKGKLAVRDSANQWAGIYFIVSVSINPLWWWGLAGLGILFILAVVIFMRKIIKIEKDKPRKPNFKEVEIDKN